MTAAMSETTEIFEAMYDALEEARCNLRKGRDVVERALAGGIGLEHQMTEQGTFKGVDLQVHVLGSEVPGRGIEIGDVADVRQPAATGTWQTFRVAGLNVTGGVVTYTMAAEHE